MQYGYYRHPSIHNNQVVFVSEDDLWTVSLDGGKAARLTANLDIINYPHFSPDGKHIAFLGKEDGNEEIYLMPSSGGVPKRLTHSSSFRSSICGWSKDGAYIYYSSNYQEPFFKKSMLTQVHKDGGLPEKLNLGHGKHLSYGSRNRSVIGRNTLGIERWKRYRGGTSGVLWIDSGGKGNFKEWEGVEGNYANPMWIGERIYFISDHKGIANIFSIKPNGTNLQEHTDHKDFYCKDATTDGKTIVYAAGADLYKLDVKTGENTLINIEYHSSRVQHQRKFVDATKYLQGYDIHPKGHSLAINSRGKSFETANWEKIVHTLPATDGVRQRLIRYLNSGTGFVLVTDEGGKEQIEIHDKKTTKVKVLKNIGYGRATNMKISPDDKYAAISNHKGEIVIVDLKKGKLTVIEKSKSLTISGFNWSKDSQWLAYGITNEDETGNISLYSLKSKKSTDITENDFMDHHPVFSPCGNYIYFLSNRIFNPVYDSVYFDLNFPRTEKPFCVILNKEAENPFLPKPLTPGEEEPHDFPKWDTKKKKKKVNVVNVDFDGIKERTVPMPVSEGIYETIEATSEGIFTLSRPIKGALNNNFYSDVIEPDGVLKVWDLIMSEEQTITSGVSSFKLSTETDTLVYASGKKLRVLGLKPNMKLSSSKATNRKTGWIDLAHIKVGVVPAKEWEQIFDEIWRLQKEHFWVEDMSGVDWNKVYKRYRPLVDRVGSRAELSNLAWEMQGELGTSHAYEIGGDYKKGRHYGIGLLGCDFVYDKKTKGYKITDIVKGDNWNMGYNAPLQRPGVNIAVGDSITAINHQALSASFSPYEALVNQAGNEVMVTVKSGKKEKTVRIKTLRNEQKLRYRAWVEANRAYVHKATGGKVGYVHLPNMGAEGYSEFHRYYNTEAHKGSLIVDVRFNGGGHVSQLILEKLSRKVIGYGSARWGSKHENYPAHSVVGPMVALTNEFAGSDGDIFSHAFKLMGLGKLIGRRTWGGVVGIWPRHHLIDGSVTTQPEFSTWFKDVGYGVENYGTDPDIFVDIKPQDYKANKDPQMDKAIAEIMAQLKKNPVDKPDLGEKPDLRLPT